VHTTYLCPVAPYLRLPTSKDLKQDSSVCLVHRCRNMLSPIIRMHITIYAGLGTELTCGILNAYPQSHCGEKAVTSGAIVTPWWLGSQGGCTEHGLKLSSIQPNPILKLSHLLNYSLVSVRVPHSINRKNTLKLWCTHIGKCM
jgi:hypothetical protein